MARAISVTFCLLLWVLPSVLGTFAGAAPPLPCGVEVSVDESHEEARITSTQPGATSTTGTYTATFPPVAERAVITLTASVDSGWPVTVSPSTIQISGSVGRTGTFSLTVIVPPAEPVKTAVVTIVAKMVAGGIQCDPSEVHEPTITVLPYIEELNLVVSQSQFVATSGQDMRAVAVAIGAKANTGASAHITYLLTPGVQLDAPSDVAMPWRSNGTANATFTVRVPTAGLEVGTYWLNITATASAADSEPLVAETGFSIEVRGGPLPGAGSLFTMLAVAAAAAGAWASRARYRRSA